MATCGWAMSARTIGRKSSQVTRGGNYGWRCREGAHDYNSAGTPLCDTAALIDPVTEYRNNGLDVAVTGGYVYRGTQIDATSRSIHLCRLRLRHHPRVDCRERLAAARTDATAGQQLQHFCLRRGQRRRALCGRFSTLQRIVFQPPPVGGTVPTTLSATGCVSITDARQPASGLIPYGINAPFWSDGAAKDRWIGLPDGFNITVQSGGDWEFPHGTVLMKNFTVGTQLIETRLFMRHSGRSGAATPMRGILNRPTLPSCKAGHCGISAMASNGSIPSEGQCIQCHTTAAGGSLGLETAQLNRDFLYPQTGRTANELFTLNHIQTLTPPMPDPAAQPRMPDPVDTSASLNDRARACLHTNCSQCHRPDGPTPSAMDLRYTTALNQTNACNIAPQAGDLGLGSAARLIAPGSANTSIIVNRANRRDANAMPPVGSNQIDTAGVALLTQWINGLTGC